MASQKNNRRRCLRCQKHRDEVGPISWGGNCKACGDCAALENAEAMREHNGPAFLHWRSRLLAAFGVVLDEPPASE